MNLGLETDAANPNFVGAHNPDSILRAVFNVLPILNAHKTSLEGRPIFDDVIHVQIMSPGNDSNIPNIRMRDEHKFRFPREWAMFKESTDGQHGIAGTPLSEWPQLRRAQVEELKGIKFFTVEQVAGASDQQMAGVTMIAGMSFHTLREKAKAYLRAAMDTALPQHQAEELAKRDQIIAEMRDEQQREKEHRQRMEAQMAVLMAELDKKTAPDVPAEKAAADRLTAALQPDPRQTRPVLGVPKK